MFLPSVDVLMVIVFPPSDMNMDPSSLIFIFEYNLPLKVFSLERFSFFFSIALLMTSFGSMSPVTVILLFFTEDSSRKTNKESSLFPIITLRLS